MSNSQYNFIVDASAFEKGLGNIRRWCDRNTPLSKASNRHITLKLYIPTYTLRELDFLQSRRKSFNARESLKYIDQLSNSSNENDDIDLIVEYPEILDGIHWDNVNISNLEFINKLPRRLKNLLKSCAYKCSQEENDDGLRWILITEDPQIREVATQCSIPWCSIIDADSILSKDLNDKSFQESENFNNLMFKNGTSKQTENGDNLVMTDFNRTVYARRGHGQLWTPS